MGLRINNNIAAMNAYRNLSVTDGQMTKSLEKLSSGFRINRAADDAAGLAISEGLRSQIGGLKVAVRNAQDGICVVQTAEGALTETHASCSACVTCRSRRQRRWHQRRRQGQHPDRDRQLKPSWTASPTPPFNGKKLLDGNFSAQLPGRRQRRRDHRRGRRSAGWARPAWVSPVSTSPRRRQRRRRRRCRQRVIADGRHRAADGHHHRHRRVRLSAGDSVGALRTTLNGTHHLRWQELRPGSVDYSATDDRRRHRRLARAEHRRRVGARSGHRRDPFRWPRPRR